MSQTVTVVDHLRTLGLDADATGDDVRAAFRRLARQYHPDLNGAPGANARFVAVVKSYRALQFELGLRPDMAHYRLCPRCGCYAELLEGLDGRSGCADCLLGRIEPHRFLPLPIFVTVRHLGVLALYVASIVLAWLYVQSPAPWEAALSLVCALGGLGLLFVACMTVPEVGCGERGGGAHARALARANPKRRAIRTRATAPGSGSEHVR